MLAMLTYFISLKENLKPHLSGSAEKQQDLSETGKL
jgi:hypothetical protein